MSIKNNKSLILKEIKRHYSIKSDADFARFLDIKPQTLSSWYSRNTFDIDLIYSKCEEIDGNWLLTGEGPMFRNKENSRLSHNIAEKNIDNQGIPLIPIDAMAGFGTGSMQIMEYDAQKYVVPEFAELKADYIIRVQGNSMKPTYNSGDLVACKKLVLNDMFFQWNKVYLLDTEQGALIKRVKKASDNHIMIVSDNTDYEPVELHLSKIHAIAIVLGTIRLD